MRKRKRPSFVLFNASVILAGLYSPRGGSAKLLDWAKKRQIYGVVSEVILDEVIRRSPKIGLKKIEVKRMIRGIFGEIVSAPRITSVRIFEDIVIDRGDAHVLATASETKADYLVSLDKKHILSLRAKIKRPKIVSPGRLIEELLK